MVYDRIGEVPEIRRYIEHIIRRFVGRKDNCFKNIFDVVLYSSLDYSIYSCGIVMFLEFADREVSRNKSVIEAEVKKVKKELSGYGLVRGRVALSKPKKIGGKYRVDVDILYRFGIDLFNMFSILRKIEVRDGSIL